MDALERLARSLSSSASSSRSPLGSEPPEPRNAPAEARLPPHKVSGIHLNIPGPIDLSETCKPWNSEASTGPFLTHHGAALQPLSPLVLRKVWQSNLQYERRIFCNRSLNMKSIKAIG